MALTCISRSATITLLATLVLLLGVPGARGQNQTDAIPPAMPEPLRLRADWWTYFEKAEGKLEERLIMFQAQLEKLATSLTEISEREDRLRGLLVQIGDLAERYLEVTSKKPPAPAPLRPVREAYTIGEFLDLSADKREATFERDLDREDVERSTRLLRQSAKRIEDTKAKYLALPTAAPERLEQGLDLIRARFIQAINEADLRLRRKGVENANQRVEAHTAELEYAEEHLQANVADAKEWMERAAKANAERQHLETEASKIRLRANTFGDNLQERARRRQLEQKLIDYEALTVSATLDALQAGVAATLAEQINMPDNTTIQALRQQRKALDEALDDLEDNLEIWRRATERERTVALAQLTDAGNEDAALAALDRSRIASADQTSEHIDALARRLALGRALSGVAAKRIAEQTGWTTELFARTGEVVGAGWSTVRELGTESLFSINETPVTAAGLIRVALVLVIAWWLSRALRHGLERAMRHRDTTNRASLYTLGRLSHYTIMVIGSIVALSSIGIDFTKFAFFVSALGVGLGFGLQAIFSNFVAGLIILFEKSLKVGDFVELESGLHGEVREINIRSILITTNDNIDILVPNAEFVNGRVTNWTLREAHRRLKVPFGVAYGTDKELVKKAALEAAAEVPFTLTANAARAPQVWLVQFGDSSLNFELVVWLTQEAVRRPSTVHAAYSWAIESALGKYGIEIPFPQRDLHVRSYFGQKDAAGLEVVRELTGRGAAPVPLSPI